jgi:peptide/nickel transport system substrate-binding protein
MNLFRVIARALACAACASVIACRPHDEPRDPRVLVVSKEQGAAWSRNFNPLSPAASPRWPTRAGVYEPLLVRDGIHEAYVPWLAEGYAWSDDRRTLTFRIREGVRWSDGAPFDADDVRFTFRLLRSFPALDRRGVWSFLEAVEAPSPREVRFTFSRVFLPGLDEIAPQPIVPAHVWREVADPVRFANANPVGTGPFTEVRVFSAQVFELGKNPHYWQPGKPGLDAIRMPAFPSNDRANLALAFGEVDWAANFVPAVERVFDARDPEHHRHWFPLSGTTVFLYANTKRPPFDRVDVRKAVSMAIDRARLVDVALFGYSRPAHATGLGDALAAWREDPTDADGAWIRADRVAAEALLDGAGLPRGADGLRRMASGETLRFDVLTVAGWSDWVRGAQVIARELRTVGIDARVHAYDFGAWFDRLGRGDFDLSLGWSVEGPTPYVFYRSLMASATAKPVGVSAEANWHRYASRQADALLAAFEQAGEPSEQQRIARELERLFVAEAPAIPLYSNPSWAEYSTRHVVGFPSPDDPYADPSPNQDERGTTLLVLTRLRPR